MKLSSVCAKKLNNVQLQELTSGKYFTLA